MPLGPSGIGAAAASPGSTRWPRTANRPQAGSSPAPRRDRRRGFGGLFAAKALRRADVDVTVIDRTNHHLFQPLLYQMATGILSEGDIAPPIRDSCAAAQRQRDDRRGGGSRPRRAPAHRQHARAPQRDPLRQPDPCTGSNQSYFGHPEFARDAPGMKTIDHALELRGRIFGAFELAERESASRRPLMTFVIAARTRRLTDRPGHAGRPASRGLARSIDRELCLGVARRACDRETLASRGDLALAARETWTTWAGSPASGWS